MHGPFLAGFLVALENMSLVYNPFLASGRQCASGG
jgi:hypothetical protein